MTRCRSGDGCREEGGHGRFGNFCAEHAAELSRAAKGMGKPKRTTTIHRSPDAEPMTTCRIDGCDRAPSPHWGDGLACYRHYGTPAGSTEPPPTCAQDGCEKAARGRQGLCKVHAAAA